VGLSNANAHQDELVALARTLVSGEHAHAARHVLGTLQLAKTYGEVRLRRPSVSCCSEACTA
jgi:hypothetical protein